MRYAVTDFETTGLSAADGDVVIEAVSLVYNIGFHRPCGVFHRYFIPEEPVSPEAYAVHGLDVKAVLGLRRRQNADYDLTWRDGWPSLLNWWRESEVKLVVGHNLDFDMSFFPRGRLVGLHGFCTMKALTEDVLFKLAQKKVLELPTEVLAEFGADEDRYVSLDRLYGLLKPPQDTLPLGVEKVLGQPGMYHSALLDALRTAYLMRLCMKLHLADEPSWVPLFKAGDLRDIDNRRFLPDREEASPMERRAKLDEAIHEMIEP
jgi:DNA polymerase III epsilon subunit-like protein